MTLEPDVASRNRLRAWIDCIARIDFPVRAGEPTPQGYYGERLGPPGPARDEALDRFLRFYLDVFGLAGRTPAGLRVLEVGSGFGLGLVGLAALGSDRASGVEIVPWQVDFTLRARECLPADVRGRVDATVGTATALPHPDETFDVVLSLEAISHYLDYGSFLDESHRVLRPGGTLLISDGNNGLNPIVRRKTRLVWASHEIDPRSEAVDPTSPWLFVPKRERIVAEAAPHLDAETAHELALRTAGMVRGQIEAAVRTHVETGALPDSPYRHGTLTVHPEHEMVMERLFDPFALGREIAVRGFDVRVRGHWGGASGSRPVRAVNRALGALSRVTMPLARGFRIAAKKR